MKFGYPIARPTVWRDAHELRTLDLRELQLLRVLDDIVQGGFEAHAVLEFDETRLLKQERAAPLIDRIISDRHRSAGGDAVKSLYFRE
jgi:hypothetical protein